MGTFVGVIFSLILLTVCVWLFRKLNTIQKKNTSLLTKITEQQKTIGKLSEEKDNATKHNEALNEHIASLNQHTPVHGPTPWPAESLLQPMPLANPRGLHRRLLG